MTQKVCDRCLEPEEDMFMHRIIIRGKEHWCFEVCDICRMTIREVLEGLGIQKKKETTH